MLQLFCMLINNYIILLYCSFILIKCFIVLIIILMDVKIGFCDYLGTFRRFYSISIIYSTFLILYMFLALWQSRLMLSVKTYISNKKKKNF